MRLPSETEVLIVGAGPSGLALATCLAGHGTKFVLVDRLTAPLTNSRAAAVHARTLEVLEPLGVTDALVKAGRQIQVVSVHDRDKSLLRINFAKLRSAYPFILTLPQNETEAILTDRLASLGGTVERGQEAVLLVPEDDRATVTLRDATGSSVRVSARYVVGADGYHSLVRQASGIGFAPGTYAESFILADVHMDWMLGSDEMWGFLAPDGMVLVAPFTGSRFRVVATVDQAPERPSIEDVQAILDRRGPRAKDRGDDGSDDADGDADRLGRSDCPQHRPASRGSSTGGEPDDRDTDRGVGLSLTIAVLPFRLIPERARVGLRALFPPSRGPLYAGHNRRREMS